jgi:hypothetical protein
VTPPAAGGLEEGRDVLQRIRGTENIQVLVLASRCVLRFQHSCIKAATLRHNKHKRYLLRADIWYIGEEEVVAKPGIISHLFLLVRCRLSMRTSSW